MDNIGDSDTSVTAEVPADGSVHLPSENPMLNGDTTRPNSADGFNHQPPPSNHSSTTSLSIEERLRRVRAAEQLKQKQRYAAYIEAQQQAELARMRQQEERKRKIEEMRQKEQARRLSALERRMALESINQARIERIRERSLNRTGTNTNFPRRRAENADLSGRTASASPSLGTARNPNSLMTTSCVVAFGSSAPRSICTQPSQAALRLKQAFEARLASYLTGRHSGCFFTAAASSYYSCFVDPSVVPRLPSSLVKMRHIGLGSSHSRRAVSAHASFLRHTKSSFARVTRHQPSLSIASNDVDMTFGDQHSVRLKYPNSTNSANEDLKEISQTTEVDPIRRQTHNSAIISTRSNSSQECDKLLNPNRTSNKNASHPTGDKFTRIGARTKSRVMSSATESVSSTRSSSAEGSTKRSNPSVFDRLASNMTRSTIVTSNDTMNTKISKSNRSAVSGLQPVKKPEKPVTGAMEAKRSGGQLDTVIPPVMSKSVCGDMVNRKRMKKPILPSKPLSPTCSSPKSEKSKHISPTSSPKHPSSTVEVNSEESEEPSAIADTTCKTDTVSNGSVALGVPDLVKEESLVQIGPIKAETHGSGEGALLSENDAALYRAKLLEQRRLAKERKEEEQRRLEEEARQRQIELEKERLAAEQAARELEEKTAHEAEEAQRLKEIEEIARAQAAEAERLAKLQRAEEERVMRKKKLDSIMSRVKQPGASNKLSSKSQDDNSSPALIQLAQPTHSDTSEPSPTASGDHCDSDELTNEIENGKMEIPISSSVPVIETSTDESIPISTKHLNEETVDSTSVPTDQLLSDQTSVNLDISNESNYDQIAEKPVFTLSQSPSNMDLNIPITSEHSLNMDDNNVSADDNVKNSVYNSSAPAHRDISDSSRSCDLSSEIDSPHEDAFLPNHDNINDIVNTEKQRTDENQVSVPTTNHDLVEESSHHTPTLAQLASCLPESDSRSSSVSSTSAPRFKSALLQSMLGGGRLSTHAKDAVVGLRRGSSSHLSSMQSSENLGIIRQPSGRDWISNDSETKINYLSTNGSSINNNNNNDNNTNQPINNSIPNSNKIRSINDMSIYSDNITHLNGSSDFKNLNTNSLYSWSNKSEHEASKPDSLSPVQLQTPTN